MARVAVTLTGPQEHGVPSTGATLPRSQTSRADALSAGRTHRRSRREPRLRVAEHFAVHRDNRHLSALQSIQTIAK